MTPWEKRRLEHGLVPVEFDMLITHAGRNVIKQMDVWIWNTGEVQARGNWGILILPSMTFHALLSGSAEDIHLPLWEGGRWWGTWKQEVLSKSPIPMTTFLLDAQYLVHSGGLPGAPGFCEFTGRMTPLSSPCRLHLTVTTLPFSYIKTSVLRFQN